MRFAPQIAGLLTLILTSVVLAQSPPPALTLQPDPAAPPSLTLQPDPASPPRRVPPPYQTMQPGVTSPPSVVAPPSPAAPSGVSFKYFITDFTNHVRMISYGAPTQGPPLLPIASLDRDLARTPAIRTLVLQTLQDANALQVAQQAYSKAQQDQMKKGQSSSSSSSKWSSNSSANRPPKNFAPPGMVDNKTSTEFYAKQERFRKSIDDKLAALHQFAGTPEAEALLLPTDSKLVTALAGVGAPRTAVSRTPVVPGTPVAPVARPMRFEVVSVADGGIVVYRQGRGSETADSPLRFVDNDGPETVFVTDRSKSVFLSGYTGSVTMGDILSIRASPGSPKKVGTMMLDGFVASLTPPSK